MKTILVTGATSGIGLAAAKRFLSLVHRVIITGRNEERLQSTAHHLTKEFNAPLIPLLCDQSKPEAIQDMAEQLKQQNVSLDALVLNAGIFLPQPFIELSIENINEQMNANFIGPALMLKALLPNLKQGASTVFVSSIAAEKAFATAGIYSASKAAFEALASVLNIELAEYGIRINSVRPGVTQTDIQRKAGMDETAITELDQNLQAIPHGGMLSPEDIVPAIELLALDSGPGMYDARIRIDGGYCL